MARKLKPQPEPGFIKPFTVLHNARSYGMKNVAVVTLDKDNNIKVHGSSDAVITELLLRKGLEQIVQPA
jgi:hypothetical protein